MIRMSFSTSFFAAALLMILLSARSAEALNANHTSCSNCHSIHGAVGPALLKDITAETVCLSCHGPAGIATTVDLHRTDTGGDFTCLECHDPHNNLTNWLAGTNLMMVLPTIITPNSGSMDTVFESRGTDLGGPTLHSFADNDEDGNGTYDGACEVCHTSTTYHRNNSSGDHSHETGRTCTTCHPHGDGFAPAGGTCTGCHAVAQDNGDNVPPGGRRAIVDEFGYASHHVSTGVTDAGCVVCHDMTFHQQGTVRLMNADNAAIVYTLTDPNLSTFCTSCHDDDGSTEQGGAPFSSALMPPVISESLWLTASHSVALLECMDCHDGGHGSMKRKLLAPFNVPPTAPANAEEEEGFCFTCHDPDGPASTDIASQFGLPIRWVADVAGPNSNLNLNDRHDVEWDAQSQSGAKIECVDCHNPHADDSTQPFRSDPDPNDGQIPGDVYVTGSDLMTDWCLDCHDGSYGPGITPPTTALVDILASHQVDSHGTAGGNASLKSGYGWAADQTLPCLACHTAHPGTSNQNLFQAKDTIMSQDGTTAIPSDSGSAYEMTDNSVKNPDINGYEWCNTCHTGSMGDKKDNCFDCHFHGTRN
ncbi:hypothetical protein KQI84_14560 [bacterium]|nr:hypothetical protein [bacterium]